MIYLSITVYSSHFFQPTWHRNCSSVLCMCMCINFKLVNYTFPLAYPLEENLLFSIYGFTDYSFCIIFCFSHAVLFLRIYFFFCVLTFSLTFPPFLHLYVYSLESNVLSLLQQLFYKRSYCLLSRRRETVYRRIASCYSNAVTVD